ncbi:hypothetical protein [Herbiconiux sp. A18JL235]|uniref:Uncharacterized protein n=1 Tax=Herbiconiux sp. A18JL235 TaxID=3152363 RepID=A0AB39BCY2_9MICO
MRRAGCAGGDATRPVAGLRDDVRMRIRLPRGERLRRGYDTTPELAGFEAMQELVWFAATRQAGDDDASERSRALAR